MKVIRQPVDMIAWFNVEGVIMPLKFRLETEHHTLETVKIHKILYHTEEKVAGNLIRTYACTIQQNNLEKPCEIKYELGTCKWILFKI
jgi:hypothetical protein